MTMASLQQMKTSMRHQDTILSHRYKVSSFKLYYKYTNDPRSQKVKTELECQ
jgi:hypothetical protein